MNICPLFLMRVSTLESESDVYRRQIPTSKVDPLDYVKTFFFVFFIGNRSWLA